MTFELDDIKLIEEYDKKAPQGGGE